MLVGVRKETTALWKIFSSPHVMAGSGAVMKRGMRQRLVMGGLWRGLHK